MKYNYVYILTNRIRYVFYIGVTSNLVQRMQEHKSLTGSKFCRKYHVDTLVYYELHIDINNAIRREKQIKKWNREWKIELIKKRNPELKDILEKKSQHL